MVHTLPGEPSGRPHLCFLTQKHTKAYIATHARTHTDVGARKRMHPRYLTRHAYTCTQAYTHTYTHTQTHKYPLDTHKTHRQKCANTHKILEYPCNSKQSILHKAIVLFLSFHCNCPCFLSLFLSSTPLGDVHSDLYTFRRIEQYG